MGQHRLHTLTMLLRVDDVEPILAADKRTEITAYLQSMTAKFVEHQHPQGYWDENWPDALPSADDPKDSRQLANRVIVTGHALEAWALSPAEVHPPRPVLVAAGQWLVRTIETMTDEQLKNSKSFLTHAARALALWRGKFPHQVPLSPEEPSPGSAETAPVSAS